MNVSQLINEIVSEWAYRVNDGMPDPKNPTHLMELGIVLSEMGLSHIKNDLVKGLLGEAEEGGFKNPALNKKINYKNAKGEDKEGIVGNLLRLPAEHPGRKAAERTLPPEGSEERDALNKDLGGEGQPTKPEEPKDKEGGDKKDGGEEEKMKQAQAMFDPKADPAMAQRLDKEKEVQAQIAKDAEAGDKEAEKPAKEEKPKNTFEPIPAQDVKSEIPQADTETFGAPSDIPDGIEKQDLEKFNTDISKVQQLVADAKAKGEKVDINLCDVTVPGTNLYCDDNLGIPRDQMPQFKGKPVPGSKAEKMPLNKDGEVDTEPVFREMLKEKGITTTQTEVAADKLKATQSELGGDKVVGMMGALEKDPNHPGITGPIYVSRDGFVIDGHHRWAAIAAYNAKYPEKQIPMKCEVIDMDIKDAIPMCNKFAEEIGIAAKKQGETTGKAGEEQPKDEPKKVSSFTKLTDKIKNKISKWQEGEKEFFEKGYYKAGAEPRRTLGQAIKDKAKGAIKAIKQGAKHEIEEFKTAGVGVGKFFKGEDLSDNEKKALKGVAIKVATTAIFGVAMGGLAAGAAGFAKHVAIEFVPHVVAETLFKGAGRAALFADAEGEAEVDANMEKFIEMISKGIEEMDINEEQMEAMVDSYNEKKDKGEIEDTETSEMKEELLPMVDKMIGQIIEGFIDETKSKNNPIGKTLDVMDQTVLNPETGRQIKVRTALDYKGDKNKGKQQAYRAAIDLLKKKGGVTDKELGIEKKPKQIPGQGLGFRKTKDLTAQPKVEPASQPASQPKKKKKKNKELNQKTNTKKNFNEGYFAQDGITDKEFKNNPKVKPTAKQMNIKDLIPFLVDKNGNTNFPKKYLKVLHRLLNTKGGSGLTISDFTDASGAGTLSSTMGELMTLMAVTIKDEAKANEFFKMIAEHVKANGKDSIIDIGWVKSAQKVRETLFKRYDRAFGKGNWQLEQMAWDIESEVEGLGLENYKQNKGFSTDVYAKVKVNGQSVLDEVSLKKELTANLLNATSNRVQDIMVRGAANDEDLKIYDDLNTKIDALAGLKDKESVAEKKKLIAERDAIIEKYNAKVPNEAKVSYAQKKQREMHQDFIKSGEKEVKEFLNKFCGNNKKYRENSARVIKNQLNQKEDYINQVTQKISQVCKEVKSGKSYAEALVGLEKADYQKLNLAIMSAIAAENPKSKAAKSYKSIIKNSHNHSKAVRDFLLKDPNARKGLFASIREAFPLKALFEGEENMILGDVSADKQVLSDVFGVNSFEELEQKLTIRDEPPPPSIVYRVAGKEDIPVAEISSRPDGIGYGGTWKLEMKVHPEFGKKLKESNSKLNV